MLGEVLSQTVQQTYWLLFVLIPCLVGTIICFVMAICESRFRKIMSIGFILLLMLTILGTNYVKSNVDDKAEGEKTERISIEYQRQVDVYKITRWYLREFESSMSVYGEIEGHIGGFLFISGDIYGKTEAEQALSVVYEDNDTKLDHYIGVHRSITFYLKDTIIITILAGEKPYFSYPEAYVGYGDCNCNGKKVWMVPGKPHLYLPEGWKIL